MSGRASRPGMPVSRAGLRDGTRLVVRGGRPDARVLAAVVAALDADAGTAGDADARAAGPPGALQAAQRSARGAAAGPAGAGWPPTQPRPSWLVAARREGVGGRPAASPADLPR